VMRTFYSVFPEGLVFQTGPGDILMVGAQQPVQPQDERLRELWQEEGPVYWAQLIGLLEPHYLLGTYVASRDQVMTKVQASSETDVLNTDDKPVLEFQAPRSLYLKAEEVASYPVSFPDLVPASYQQDPPAKGEALLGRFQLNRLVGLNEWVERGLEEQLPWAPLAGALLAQRSGNPISSAEGLLKAVDPARAAEPSAQILLGNLRAQEKQWDLAALHYETALTDPPPGSRYITLMKLGNVLAQMQRLDEALEVYQQAAEITVRPDPYFQMGHLSFLQSRDPELSLAYFEKALERDPYDYASLFRAALLNMQLGRVEQGLKYSRRSYELFRENRENVELLADILAQTGEEAEAARLRAEAAELKRREVQQQRTQE